MGNEEEKDITAARCILIGVGLIAVATTVLFGWKGLMCVLLALGFILFMLGILA